jgi:hypothetical protein
VRVTVKPVTYLFPSRFDRLQLMSALVWGATMLGVAIAAKASTNFIYELLVLFVGFNMSWVVIDLEARRSGKDDAAKAPELSPVTLAEETASSRPGSHTP